jgi:caffeoyl-CoA O-methyltransferase
MITPLEIEKYCEAHSSPSLPVFDALAAATREFAPNAANMQVGNLEGRFLSFFASAIGAKHILEFGTFTGCSSIHFALSIADDGRITTLDRDPGAVAIARKFWDLAGVSGKIESLIGDAVKTSETIEAEIRSGLRERFDLAFIDADKASYPTYFERSLSCVKKGGWILVDNVLWSGRVLKPEDSSDHAIHRFNELCRNDSRVEHLLLPLRDGVMICRVKS